MCLSSCFLSRLLCSCIEWCNCRNSPQNRHKNTLFAHSIKLLSQQSQIYATRTELRRAAQKITFNMRSKNRQLSSPQAVIRNVHIKLNLGNQVQKHHRFQFMLAFMCHHHFPHCFQFMLCTFRHSLLRHLKTGLERMEATSPRRNGLVWDLHHQALLMRFLNFQSSCCGSCCGSCCFLKQFHVNH